MDQQTCFKQGQSTAGRAPQYDFVLIGCASTIIEEADHGLPADADNPFAEQEYLNETIKEVNNTALSSRAKAQCFRKANLRLIEELLLAMDEENLAQPELSGRAGQAHHAPAAVQDRGQEQVTEASRKTVTEWLEMLPDCD